jgi:hypothetical protein
MTAPRLFELVRHVDVTGKSGTGVVAHGAQWPDGTVSLRWAGATPSFSNWDSLDVVIAVHGHEGATEVRWLDERALLFPDHFTEYQWRPASDPRFGTGDGPGWFHANSKEHALHMQAMWNAELRQRLVGGWDPFGRPDDDVEDAVIYCNHVLDGEDCALADGHASPFPRVAPGNDRWHVTASGKAWPAPEVDESPLETFDREDR